MSSYYLQLIFNWVFLGVPKSEFVLTVNAGLFAACESHRSMNITQLVSHGNLQQTIFIHHHTF